MARDEDVVAPRLEFDEVGSRRDDLKPDDRMTPAVLSVWLPLTVSLVLVAICLSREEHVRGQGQR